MLLSAGKVLLQDLNSTARAPRLVRTFKWTRTFEFLRRHTQTFGNRLNVAICHAATSRDNPLTAINRPLSIY